MSAGVQEYGRRLLANLYAALRALKLYPIENAAVQQSLDELHSIANKMVEAEAGMELRVVGEFFFLNETRLRLDLSNFATFGSFASTLQDHGIGSMEVLPGVMRNEWAAFLSLLLRKPDPDDPYGAFLERLEATPVEHIHTRPESELTDLDKEEALHAAKRTYVQSVQVAKEALGDLRLGRAVNVRRVKRAVQGIVDQVLANEPSIMTMTTLRDFDEYTFTHCVNVCIFSVVIGQRLGLTKLQLYELGLGALLHDIGKMRIPKEIINKPEGLDDDEWARIREHPTEGLLMLFRMAGFADVPYRQMLMAYEHHMKGTGAGYPSNHRGRRIGLFSRVVAVADAFDAGTSVRSYQYKPFPPDEVLKEMRDNPQRGYDPLLVKALITATGVFPVGTLAILDTMEMAVVAEVNTNPDLLHLPRVKIISDEMGIPLDDPVWCDLSDQPTDGPHRTILKTTDPQKYGIRVSDYIT
ncbi:MAG: HD domain-containing protein [Gemmatimonadetes bacterium]|nr:HD domain-containing protein [Gemmatimonadota bacterium]